MIATLALLLAAAAAPAAAGQAQGAVVADTLWSQALGTRKQVLIYLPPSYAHASARRYPVAYYLHGLGASETQWQRLGLPAAMDSLVAGGGPEMIVVMPDGDDSWYTTWHRLPDYGACRASTPRNGESVDAFCVPWPHYDDYVARDLVRFVDARYRTRADRAHRAIAGLSMGGYGAMALALAYPEVFAAAASHSGVLAPREWAPEAFAVAEPHASGDSTSVARWRRALAPSMLAAFGPDSIGWNARDPAHLLDRARARRGPLPALFADCGTEDPFIHEHRRFRHEAERRGVTLAYREHPGGHAGMYWRAHVGESLAWIGVRIGG